MLLCPWVQGDHISKAIKDPLGRGTAICSHFYNIIFSANFLPVLLLRLCRPEAFCLKQGLCLPVRLLIFYGSVEFFGRGVTALLYCTYFHHP